MAETFADRFGTAKKRANMSNYALAKATGIADNLLGKYDQGSMPNMEYAAKISEALGVSLFWLATGKGSINPPPRVADDPEFDRIINHLGNIADEEARKKSLTDNFSLIPRLSVEASAGAGAVNHTEETAQMLAFPVGWLHRMGLSHATAKVLAVRGDSMAPTLQDGDLLLVDTAVERVQEAGIYVVGVDDRILVKRIQPRIDGSLQLISENPVYSPEEIPAGLAEKLRVLGRVRWYGRSI